MNTTLAIFLGTLVVLVANTFSAWLGLSFFAWLFNAPWLITGVSVAVACGVITLLQALVLALLADK